MLRLRGRCPVLWRKPGQCQIGADPAQALIIDDLSDAEQHMLLRCADAVSLDDFSRAARLTHTLPARAQALVGRLRSLGVLVDTPHASDDEYYWEHLICAPSERTQALRDATVALLGTGPLVTQVALLLADAGVGSVLTEDPTTDAHLRTRYPRLRSRRGTRQPTDLAVLINSHVIDPVRERALSQDGVAHVVVVCREVTISVGPLFDDAAPVCRTCLELWECDADPCWPAVATQARLLPPPPLEGLLCQQGAVLAARAVLDCLVDNPRAWHGMSVDLSASVPVGQIRRWQPHPQCACSHA